MEVSSHFIGQEKSIADVFQSAFSASESEAEGLLIGELAANLMANTPKNLISVFHLKDRNTVIAAVIFTALNYPEDPRRVMLLSPMAVAPAWQRKGVGQKLLNHALSNLQKNDVDVVITYGDPAYYERVGFAQISQEQAKPPLPLSMPHGWLGQSLTVEVMPTLKGPSSCVTAMNRADIW